MRATNSSDHKSMTEHEIIRSCYDPDNILNMNVPALDAIQGEEAEPVDLPKLTPTPLPFPRGVVLLYQPMVVLSGYGEYSHPLVEGECEECGRPQDAKRITLEVGPEGAGLSLQCQGCGATALLAVFQGKRTNG